MGVVEGQRYQFAVHSAILHHEFADAHGKLESSRTRAARIEIKHSVAERLLGNVAMSGDYNREARRLRLEIQFGKVVQNVNGNAADLKHVRFRQPVGPWSFVNVPANSGDRGNLGKPFENPRRADIASMNKVV